MTVQLKLTAEDSRAARRVVGFLEYGKALEHLDRLANWATPEELSAINSIIADREEFTVYNRLPEAFAPESGSQVLTESRETVTEHLGLDWVIALARVEFGAIVAAFTDHPDPYMFVTDDSFARSATLKLLLEGVAGHYRSMRDEANFADFEKQNGTIYSQLSYSRRVRIARAMLRPLVNTGPSSWTSEQARQIESCREYLEFAQTYLTAAIRSFLASRTYQGPTTTETRTREFAAACGRLLSAERREIRAGTARITRFDQPGNPPK